MSTAEARQALSEARRKIDDIDRQLRELLNKRAEAVLEVLQAKQALDLPVHEPNREEQVLANVTTANRGPLDDESLRRLFRFLMTEMREFQKLRRAQ